ncbi:ferredoxin [Lentzea sp. NPDC004789]
MLAQPDEGTFAEDVRQCVLAAPEVFDRSDDDGLGVVVIAAPPAGLLPGVRDAVDRCPAQAVTLEE